MIICHVLYARSETCVIKVAQISHDCIFKIEEVGLKPYQTINLHEIILTC